METRLLQSGYAEWKEQPKMEELLGRTPAQVQLEEIMSYVGGRRILVTGAGGSIGSELCRQIAAYHPKLLIMLDIYENHIYELQQELMEKHPEVSLKVRIASITNGHGMEQLFQTWKPEVVYHAAAHKHVPLMEENPEEAIRNNVFGTLRVAEEAMRIQTERFVLISTDKAVNPVNIMGATKLLCEKIIRMLNRQSGTRFLAVRFGNVFGSSGSVVPLFEREIAEKRPVTVTHPGMTRYFMTIPEAAALVLQAGAYMEEAEMFVLDMGEPVNILELAKRLIRQAGCEPQRDIPIVFTGLRPGEKLSEELAAGEEEVVETHHPGIYAVKQSVVDEYSLRKNLIRLQKAAETGSEEVKELLKEILPEYCPRG